ncbi:MAG: ABC transporter substrate-binding protein, partial [Geminicoccaceae bacterium]
MRRWQAIAGLCIGAWCLIAAFASVTWAETIRFSPGEEAPLAYNPTTGIYEQRLNLDPLYCAEEPCIELLHNIFEPLVSTAADQTVKPELAVRWERLDPRTYRFWLRRNVVFHNGEPFDSAAVIFSLSRASAAFGQTAWFPKIDGVQAVDEFTVDVVLRRPDSVFLHRLANIGLILPPRYFREVGQRRFGAEPVGTGPFRFTAWDRARREIKLEANRSYWRTGYPELDGVVYAYMDSDEALDRLIAGDLHLIRRLHPRKTRRFMETDAGYVVKAWLPQLVIGPFNLLKPATPLRDLRVRRAINLAINREHLVRYGATGNGRVLTGYTTPEDRNRADLDPYMFD